MTKVLDPLRSSAASGSIGDTTYSRNQYGQYVRARTTPTQPDTTKQVNARTSFSAAVTAWQSTLTAAERTSWQRYADQVLSVDSLGQPQRLSGFQAYLRYYMTVDTASITPVTTAPIIFARADRDPTVYISFAISGNPDAEVYFDDSLEWNNTDGAHMLIYSSKPGPATRNFYRSPWQYIDKIDGSSSSPTSSPTYPNFAAMTYSNAAGQLLRLKFVIVLPDGRTSSPFQTAPTELF